MNYGRSCILSVQNLMSERFFFSFLFYAPTITYLTLQYCRAHHVVVVVRHVLFFCTPAAESLLATSEVRVCVYVRERERETGGGGGGGGGYTSQST